GGLITERLENVESKVPLLGDVPILGWLFKSTTKHVQKNNLLVFLTPYVIRDRTDVKRIYERKEREWREFSDRGCAFADRHDRRAQIDYRKKRGLLAEMNRVVDEIEQDESARAQIRRSRENERSGQVEPDKRPALSTY